MWPLGVVEERGEVVHLRAVPAAVAEEDPDHEFDPPGGREGPAACAEEGRLLASPSRTRHRVITLGRSRSHGVRRHDRAPALMGRQPTARTVRCSPSTVIAARGHGVARRLHRPRRGPGRRREQSRRGFGPRGHRPRGSSGPPRPPPMTPTPTGRRSPPPRSPSRNRPRLPSGSACWSSPSAAGVDEPTERRPRRPGGPRRRDTRVGVPLRHDRHGRRPGCGSPACRSRWRGCQP